MSRGCQECQESVVAAGGSVAGLRPGLRAHLEGCPECAALASAEERLHRALEQSLPEDDEALQDAIFAALPRRRSAWWGGLLPLAASVVVAVTGAVLMGGVPGSDLLAHLPSVSSGGVVALSGVLTDWMVALVAVARTGSGVIPGSIAWSALLVAVGGTSLLAGAARRWRGAVAWR